MKICIITPRFPFPENGGDVLRINNIARYLKSRGHELTLLSFHERDYDMEAARQLYDKIYTVGRRKKDSTLYSALFMLSGRPIQCGYYYSRAFRRELEKIVRQERPDRYIAHLLRTAPYLESLGLADKSVVEMTDALSKTYFMSSKAQGGVLKKVIYSIEKYLIRRYEREVAERFPKAVLVSQSDIDYLRSLYPAPSLALHSNGVEFPPAVSESYDSRKICFIGNMRTLQNQDAVLHFVNDILPLIERRVPGVKFFIVGAEPPRNIRELSRKNDNIVVTGFVDDISAVISDSCVAVAPIQIAAGIQNKVLMAMASRLPVVMTPLIAGAIPELESGLNCVISDSDEHFADSCARLMTNPELRQSIAQRGYDCVKEHYSWNEKLKGYEDI